MDIVIPLSFSIIIVQTFIYIHYSNIHVLILPIALIGTNKLFFIRSSGVAGCFLPPAGYPKGNHCVT